MSVPSSFSGARTSRRTLMKGAAWAVPAVTVTAPALAASMSSCISSEVADDIEKIFAAHKANPAKYPGQNAMAGAVLEGWMAAPGSIAGELANPSFFKLRNKGSKTFQFSKYPLNFEFGVMNVATSPAMNNTLAGSTVGNIIKVHVKNPWQPASATADYVNSCARRRDLNISTSYGTFYNVGTGKRIPGISGENDFTCATDSHGTHYDITLHYNRDLAPNAIAEAANYQLRSGLTTIGKRIYVALGARVLGFVPPQWDDVVAFAKAQDPRWTNEDDIRVCYWAAYQARVKRWNTAKLANGSTEALAGATLKYTGWAKGLNGVFKDLEPGEWIWSHETGNYLTAGSEGNTPHLGTVVGDDIQFWRGRVGSPQVNLQNRDGVF